MNITVNNYSYKCIGKDSRKADSFMRRYRVSKGDLFDYYVRPSSDKESAWNEILRRLSSVRITGASTYMFSCAGKLVDEETGKSYFAIETSSQSYIVDGDSWNYFLEKYCGRRHTS